MFPNDIFNLYIEKKDEARKEKKEHKLPQQ